MLELLITSLAVFAFFIPFFIIFSDFFPIKVTMASFQFILSIIFLMNMFYKQHSLYNEPQINYIQNLTFYPIKSLHEIYGKSGYLINIGYDTMKNTEFSLIETEKYSTKCLENYYISSNESCPITDIKLAYNKNNEYKNYFKINDYKYIYYSNENKNGKLYKSFNYKDFLDNKKDTFSLDTIIRKEFNKLSNPIYDFKTFIKFCDIIILALSFSSIFCSIFGYCIIGGCNLFKVMNVSLQLSLLILNIIRYWKFIKIKHFLFDNEDIYDIDEESYYPNKKFNIDSISLATSINFFIFIYIILSQIKNLVV